MIACTSNCIYQINGCCRLERAGSKGIAAEDAGCVYFVPKNMQDVYRGNECEKASYYY